MILNTSFLVDLIQGNEEAIEKAKKLQDKKSTIKISSATVFELYTGFVRSNKPSEEKKKVLRVIDSKEVIEADKEIMEKAGKLHGILVNKGGRIGSFDCIIAATAVHLGETLLTKNVRDFEKVDLLELEEY